jgi:hypothetical protein
LREHRNLVTVRRLLTQGDWLTAEKVRNAGDEGEMPSAFQTLWSMMRRNRAFHGVVAGTGEQMIGMAEKQRSGVLEAARTNTEFLDSIPMQRILTASDFDLAEIKTNPQGLTVFLTLPQRFMETHYRWLRLMIVLAVGEMERIKGRPATGRPQSPETRPFSARLAGNRTDPRRFLLTHFASECSISPPSQRLNEPAPNLKQHASDPPARGTIVSANLRRKPPLIARPPYFECAPLQLT